MAAQIVGLVFVHRLGRICISSQRHFSKRDIFAKSRECRRERQAFSTGSVKCNENEGDASPRVIEVTSRPTLLSRRRRPLSPLERISGMLPQDALSVDVMQLREQNQQAPANDPGVEVSVTHSIPDRSGTTSDESGSFDASDATEELDTSGVLQNEEFHQDRSWPTVPGESLLAFGELLVAEYSAKGRRDFKKMFQLQSGQYLQSCWGIIRHNDIVGQPAGRLLNTNRGVPILIYRPSLEDYVLLMKRGPAITYPKVHDFFVCNHVK